MTILGILGDHIDVDAGEVRYVDASLAARDGRVYPKEDLLQVAFGSSLLLDAGWYGPLRHGCYRVVVVRDFDWERPAFTMEASNDSALKTAIECAVRFAMTQLEEAFLRTEFEAADDSFLSKLRIDLTWDEARFAQLVEALTRWCERTGNAEHETLDRWVVQGFWLLHTFTPSWVRHESFPKPRGTAYYETAFELIELLADWAFTGASPFRTDIRQVPEYAPYFPPAPDAQGSK